MSETVPLFKKYITRIHPRAWDYIELVRLVDLPAGSFLLLWPTLSALWFAGGGTPSLKNVLIFTVGVVLMHSAGCAINDYVDRDFDGSVRRTQGRPIPSGRISGKEALIVCMVLMLIGFGLVLLTNPITIALSVGALLLALCYPFAKRFTGYPQVVLGAAYSWAILMAFTAETGSLPAIAWLLYLGNIFWIVGFDTYYAITDREDDLRIGIKSTAITFGRADRQIILSLHVCSLLCLLAAGLYSGLGIWFVLGLLLALILFVREYHVTRNLDPGICFKAFLHNNRIGFVVFAGIVADYALT